MIKKSDLTPEQLQEFDKLIEEAIKKVKNPTQTTFEASRKAIMTFYKCCQKEIPTPINETGKDIIIDGVIVKPSEPMIFWAEDPNHANKIIAKLEEILKLPKTGNHTPSFEGQGASVAGAMYGFYQLYGETPENSEDLDKLTGIIEMSKHCGNVYFFKQAVITCQLPIEVHIDDDFRYHNANGPSLVYKDSAYSLAKGIKYIKWRINDFDVPEKVVENPKLITLEDIIKENNNDIRRIMMEVSDMPKILAEQCKLIEKNEYWGDLYTIPNLKDEDDKPISMILVTNFSPEITPNLPKIVIDQIFEKAQEEVGDNGGYRQGEVISFTENYKAGTKKQCELKNRRLREFIKEECEKFESNLKFRQYAIVVNPKCKDSYSAWQSMFKLSMEEIGLRDIPFHPWIQT